MKKFKEELETIKQEINLYFALPKYYLTNEPCSHPGCMSHKSHPCEDCGRQWGNKE